MKVRPVWCIRLQPVCRPRPSHHRRKWGCQRLTKYNSFLSLVPDISSPALAECVLKELFTPMLQMCPESIAWAGCYCVLSGVQFKANRSFKYCISQLKWTTYSYIFSGEIKNKLIIFYFLYPNQIVRSLVCCCVKHNTSLGWICSQWRCTLKKGCCNSHILSQEHNPINQKWLDTGSTIQLLWKLQRLIKVLIKKDQFVVSVVD